ncbi:thermonuclease family protein [Roseospira navarrensis]|uniref:TNase-like domain-containing protein n=1 Tax=Roseospira navarrensis TaxID=140058 RepID=A0A7X1ZEE3_9PROT|nr:thermonuclease family protein [Roseospira navarrensis]MQX37025.1 hypothetical protein [Roseospira navarrensis]
MRRWSLRALALAVGLTAAGAALAGLVAGAAGLVPPARAAGPDAVVIDGDTIQLPDGVYHLHGIDAPELGQRCRRAGRWMPCGKDAAFALHRLLGLSLTPPICRQVESTAADGGDKRFANCALDEKKDLALVLLAQGLAVTLADAPARYREAEESARAGGLGVWGTDFVHPHGWRKGGRLPDDPVAEAAPPCPIKALMNPDGHGIYMVPLDPGYADIPDDAVVTRYCSDDTAEANGWRRSPFTVLMGED